jgi:septal ring factor EnvC (AmiA/AmiB activator)
MSAWLTIRRLCVASLAGQLAWVAIVTAAGLAEPGYSEARDAAINLSNRVDRLERQVAKLNKAAKQTAALTKQVHALGKGVGTVESQVKDLDQRVTRLTKRFDSATDSAEKSGGKSAP